MHICACSLCTTSTILKVTQNIAVLFVFLFISLHMLKYERAVLGLLLAIKYGEEEKDASGSLIALDLRKTEFSIEARNQGPEKYF